MKIELKIELKKFKNKNSKEKKFDHSVPTWSTFFKGKSRAMFTYSYSKQIAKGV